MGAVQKLGFGSDAGLRVGIARQLASGWEVGFTYTYFYTSASGSAAEPANGNLWATRNHPALYEEAATANAFSSLKYHVFDLEASYQWCLSPSANVKMFGGPRLGNDRPAIPRITTGGTSAMLPSTTLST